MHGLNYRPPPHTAAPKLALPSVTLCCVDTRRPELAIRAMAHCMSLVDFGAAILFTDLARAPAHPGVALRQASIASSEAYSHFVLKDLAAHIQTDHVLLVQWDGYVIDPSAWDPAFLEHDYIGAPWHDQPEERAVGNGGFSLRSKRLLNAVASAPYRPSHPEDVCIGVELRPRLEREHGLRFATKAMAARFAFERTTPEARTFGFHGMFNFDSVMPTAELRALLNSLPDDMMRGLDAHDLARSLLNQGDWATAEPVVLARRRMGMRDRRSLRLRWRHWLQRQLSGQGPTPTHGVERHD